MIKSLEKVNTIRAYQIHQTMLLGQPARPHADTQIFQRFRFAQTSEGVAQHCFHQSQHAQSRSTL